MNSVLTAPTREEAENQTLEQADRLRSILQAVNDSVVVESAPAAKDSTSVDWDLFNTPVNSKLADNEAASSDLLDLSVDLVAHRLDKKITTAADFSILDDQEIAFTADSKLDDDPNQHIDQYSQVIADHIRPTQAKSVDTADPDAKTGQPNVQSPPVLTKSKDTTTEIEKADGSEEPSLAIRLYSESIDMVVEKIHDVEEQLAYWRAELVKVQKLEASKASDAARKEVGAGVTSKEKAYAPEKPKEAEKVDGQGDRTVDELDMSIVKTTNVTDVRCRNEAHSHLDKHDHKATMKLENVQKTLSHHPARHKQDQGHIKDVGQVDVTTKDRIMIQPGTEEDGSKSSEKQRQTELSHTTTPRGPPKAMDPDQWNALVDLTSRG